MTRIITARADKVSPTEFLRAVLSEPRQYPLQKLCSELWDAAVRNDREAIARIRREIADLSLVEVERGIDPETGNPRIAA